MRTQDTQDGAVKNHNNGSSDGRQHGINSVPEQVECANTIPNVLESQPKAQNSLAIPNSTEHTGLTLSRSNSSSHHDPIIVPRDKRRGLFARIALIAEVENPLDYRRGIKWMLTGFIGLAAAAGPTASAIFLRM